MKKSSLLILLLLLLSCQSGFGQHECTDCLDKATVLFDSGKLNDVLTTISNCRATIDCSVSERIRGLKLLATVHLRHGEFALADSLARKILILEPDYRCNPSIDPPEFVKLMAGLSAEPNWYWGICTGVNFCHPIVQVDYDLGKPNSLPEAYRPVPGIMLGAQVGFRLRRKLDLGTELALAQKRIHHSSFPDGLGEIKYRESLFYLAAPVYLSQHFGRGRFRPFVKLGAAVDFLLYSEYDLKRFGGPGISPTYNGDRTSSLPRRFRWDLSGLVGAGIAWQKNYRRIALECRYRHGIYTLRNGPDPELAFLGYTDDAFSLRQFEVSLSVHFLMIKIYDLKRDE